MFLFDLNIPPVNSLDVTAASSVKQSDSKPVIDATKTLITPTTPITQLEKTVWQKIVEFFTGRRPTDTRYSQLLDGVKRLDSISDPQDKRAALIDNAKAIVQRIEPVLRLAKQNMESGKNLWDGLSSDMGIPPNPEMYEWTNSFPPKSQFYYNLFLYNFALLKSEELGLVNSKDADGTFVDKSIAIFATRTFQAYSQMHNHKRSLDLAQEHGLFDTMVNTARLEHGVLAAAKGLNYKATIVPHNSGIEELAGFSLEEQCALLQFAQIAMGNGSVKTFGARGFTEISSNMLLTDKLLTSPELKEFVDRVFIEPARKHEYSINEVKGLNAYVMDHARHLGEVAYEHGKYIALLYSRHVIEAKDTSMEDRLQNFKDAVLNDFEHGVTTGYVKWEAYEKAKSDFAAGSVSKNKVEEAKRAALPHIRLIGSDFDSFEKRNLKGLDSNNPKPNQVLNYFQSLCDDPQAFIENVHRARPIGFCSHFFNSRGTPYLEAINEAVENLRHFAYDDNVRDRIKDLRLGEYIDSRVGKVKVNIGVDEYVESCAKQFSDENNDRRGLISLIQEKFIFHLNINYRFEEISGLDFLKIEDLGDNKYSYTMPTPEELVNSSGQKDKSFDSMSVDDYVEFLSKKIQNVSKTIGEDVANNLSAYVRGIVPKNFDINKINSQLSDRGHTLQTAAKLLIQPNAENFKDNNDSLQDVFKLFMPDELFARKGQKASGSTTSIPIFRLDEKSDPLNKLGQYYYEIIANNSKAGVFEDFRTYYLENKVVINSGDTSSDVDAHAAALLRGGMARIIYDIITEKEIFVKMVGLRSELGQAYEVITRGTLESERKAKELYYAYNNPQIQVKGLKSTHDKTQCQEIYAVRAEPSDRGTDVITITESDEISTRLDEKAGSSNLEKVVPLKAGDKIKIVLGRVLTKDEVAEEHKKRYSLNIDHSLNPGEMLCKETTAMQLLTGAEIAFDVAKRDQAKQLLAKNNGRIDRDSLSPEERKLWDEYGWAVAEQANRRKLSPFSPTNNCFREYHTHSGHRYYLYADGKYRDKEGEPFKGSIRDLASRMIVREPVTGVFLYDDNKEPFSDQMFLNKLFVENKDLPSPTESSGLFENKMILNILGFGNPEKGKIRLENNLRVLPKTFPKFLEWCGGLMALGGGLRLLGHFVGGNVGQEDGLVYKVGYWLSNMVRAGSAIGGGLRGILNVNKNWDIAFGEAIGIVSALFLPNGPKHFGLALGNIFLFSGRGTQAAMRAQRVNAPTVQEKSDRKLDDNTVDPRGFVINLSKFVNNIALDVKRRFSEGNLSPVIGEIFGKLSGSIGTQVKVITDVITNPKLIFQWSKRVSEKTGDETTIAPSGGHILALTGILSGIGAIFAGTFGRSEKFGEKSDFGFNKLGSIGISLATSIASLGIISNGLEIAANTQGLPPKFGGLDGKDMTYNAKRAGWGQVIAGIGYAVFPLFGLNKDWVASLFDLANGSYFGLPGMNMGVAEEEKINSFDMAQGELIYGQRLMKPAMDEENKLGITDELIARAKYWNKQDNGKYSYNPKTTAAV